MSIVGRLRAIILLVYKRILSQPGLSLASFAGLVIAMAITMSIPIYTDAVYYQTFIKSVVEVDTSGATLPRPPFAFMFRYGDGLNNPVQLEDTFGIDEYLTTSLAGEFGLPLNFAVRHYRSEPYPLYPQGAAVTLDSAAAVGWSHVSSVTDIEEHITLLGGSHPVVSAENDEDPMEVLVSRVLAEKLTLTVGDNFFLYLRDRNSDGIWVTISLPVRIAGVWEATDPADPFWLVRPAVFDEHLLVPEETFIQRLSPLIPDEIYGVVWYLVFDGDNVSHSVVGGLVERINSAQQRTSALLPGVRLLVSPRDQLVTYLRDANILNALLFAFGVPVIGLLLMFIVLTRVLALEQRRNEIAVLRSRGAMRLQMIGVGLLEELLLGGLALLAAVPLAVALANLMGQTRSFLNFGSEAREMRVLLSPTVLLAGVIILLIALLAQLVPTLGASRHTVITYKQERARWQQRPLWQRLWLDILLLIPVAYGAYLLRQQGSLAVMDNEISRNLFENPLLFLVPSIGLLALALLFLRLMPLLLGAVTWLVAHTPSVALLMAARQLARTPGLYSTPLLLLVLTLSLSAFTASLAQTLDTHLVHQSYYLVGADLTFSDFGEDQTPGQEAAPGSGPNWIFRPVSDYVQATGAQAATRVGAYPAVATLAGNSVRGGFVGVDRFDFSSIAFWRGDFAGESLGGLMNILALNPDGLLMPAEFMARYSLQLGDVVRVVVDAYNYRSVLDLRIVGTFDLFPTYVPADGPLYVGNLDYFFERAGAPFPYQVWLKLEGDAPVTIGAATVRLPENRIISGQQRPERQGIFGMLSVGFLAASALTVIGFLLYVLFSFRRRLIEMGVLRAVGLSRGQMAAYLAWELAFLTLLGATAGTLLGIWTSTLFIPYMQIDSGPTTGIPPVLPEIAWSAIFRIYILFLSLFLVGLAGMAFSLRRMKIFQAIKMGETA